MTVVDRETVVDSGRVRSATLSGWRTAACTVLSLAVIGLFQVTPAAAQPRYGEVFVPAVASGEEISNQPGLWVMDVYFKPLRMIAVDITNPQTGEKEPRYVQYLVYRAINRKLASPIPQLRAENELDEPVLPPKFIPEFTLVTTDGDEPQVYSDVIVPEALAEINRRERRNFANSVGVVTSVPPAVDAKAPDQQEIYGVAMFVGVDQAADRYTVYLTGFSNGVRTVMGPDGEPIVQHKTIEMTYWRPGDEFDPKEPEVRLVGQPRWIYR